MLAAILGIRKLRQEVHEFEANFDIQREILSGKFKRENKIQKLHQVWCSVVVEVAVAFECQAMGKHQNVQSKAQLIKGFQSQLLKCFLVPR